LVIDSVTHSGNISCNHSLVCLTVKYMLVLCANFGNVHEKYFMVSISYSCLKALTIILLLIMAAHSNGHTIIFWPCGFFFLSSSSICLSFPCLISAVADWVSTILLHMVWPWANLECRSEMCCVRLPGNAGPKKSPSGHHRTTLSGYIFTAKAYIDNRKKLVKQKCLPHMSSNMVNLAY